jgi:uncharacterized protein (UPF0303 family)
VSGLESSEDHALAVAALRELANESQGQHETQQHHEPQQNEGEGE